MKIVQTKEVSLTSQVPLGVVKITWKEDVRASYGVIGSYHSGARWLALSNWTSDDGNPTGLLANYASTIDTIEYLVEKQ